MYGMFSKTGIGLLSLLMLLAGGCASLPLLEDRQMSADRIARAGGLEKTFVKTHSFSLTSYWRGAKPGDPLNLYIEGDGAAWLSRMRLSSDPTPREPIVLAMAGMDPAANVAYLARPGQYAAPGSSRGDPAYWSDKRFSGEVVAALGEAIDQLILRSRARGINLVGYSGGAALAVLIAAQRTDVLSLRTVAGNLDPEALNRYHGVSPLDRTSLDPLEVAEKLRGLPQRHFIGSQDSVVPSFIVRSFLKRAGSLDGREVSVVEGATHVKGWREKWKSLLAESF